MDDATVPDSRGALAGRNSPERLRRFRIPFGGLVNIQTGLHYIIYGTAIILVRAVLLVIQYIRAAVHR